MKFAFLSFDKELFHVLLGTGEDENVIQINKGKYIDEVPKDVVDQSLKDCRGVSQPARHEQILIMTGWGVEGCFPLVPYPHPN